MDKEQPMLVAQIAQQDFARARRRAFFGDLVATIRRKPHWLLSFAEVEKTLPIRGHQYKGMQQVPVANIVGSVDRYRDFDRAFLPTQAHTRPRWESVDIAALTDVELPPIQVYKVGEVYFVKDGNHRVSVARERGADFIDAEVIDCPTSAPLSLDTDPRELLQLAEYGRFLEQTNLDKLRGHVDITFSALGRYDTLIEHISAHRWYMGIDQHRPVGWEEAVIDWYDNLYRPLVHMIEEYEILRGFPGRTAGDLYLWIMDHRWYLREQSGSDIGLDTAALSYVENFPTWTRRVMRALRRLRQNAVRPLVISAGRLARALRATASAPVQPEPPSEPPLDENSWGNG